MKMANDIRSVIQVGRLTRDPELRQVKNSSVCKFSIASNRSYTVNGEKREKVSYFNCVSWGKQAEILNQYLKKGMQVVVNGSLDQQQWTDSNGIKRYSIDIVCEKVQFIGSRDSQERTQHEPVGLNSDAKFPDYG